MEHIKANAEVKAFLSKIASKGGNERAKKLSKTRRLEIAMMGVKARKKNA